MKAGEWTMRSRRVVTPSGTRAADVLIRNEVVVELRPHDGPEAEGVILDVGDLAVLPGLVALHREGPGSIDRRWSTAETRRWVADGVTTLIQLPGGRDLVPGDSSVPSRQMSGAEGRVGIDSGLVVALGRGNAGRIGTWIEAGYLGVEAILGNETDVSASTSTEADLRAAMPILADLGRPLLVNSGPLAYRIGSIPFGSSLPGPEFDSIRLLIRLCRETRCRVHLIHPSASEALPMLAEARAEGLPLTVATCPSHLGLESIAVVTGAFVSPPTSRGRLWEALESGLIDAIDPDAPWLPTDSPTPAGNQFLAGPIEAAPLRPTLPAVWAEARRLGFTLDNLGRWLAGGTAGAVGLGGRKGSIAPGYDADLVVFDPEPPAPGDPWPGGPAPDPRSYPGRVEATILRGTLIHLSGQFFEHPRGAIVLRLEETQPIPGTDA